MLAESRRLEEQINALDLQLKGFPEGKIVFSRTGKYSKWYLMKDKEKIYIPKSNRSFAEQLAAKKYLSSIKEDLLNEKKAIDFYLRHHNMENKQAELLYNSPEYTELLSPYFTPASRELLDWMNSPYKKNEKYPEQLVHKTISGNYVRSKSEAIIDMALYTKKIPFRYESALTLGDITVYPDFTIRHPLTGKIYYWEHFGLMDEPIYCKSAHSKLQLYTSHNIIPTIQLITTYETKETPLGIEMVEKIVDYYFL